VRTIPVKYLYDVRDERAGQRINLPLLSVSLTRGVIPRSELVGSEPRAEDFSSYKVCSARDVVINRMSAYQGAIGISAVEGLVSPDYLVLRPRSNIESRYLAYLLKSTWFVGQMTARLRGIGSVDQGNVRTPRINSSDLGSIVVRPPHRAAQRAIADYLDTETARIDALIAKKDRMVDMLNERIDSMAAACIGRSTIAGGHEPAAEIRRLLIKVRRAPIGQQVVTAFRDGQVTARNLRRAEGYTEAWTENAAFQLVLAGDVVVHGLDGFAGAIGTSEVSGICSPVYHVLEAAHGGDTDFYGRLLRVLAVSGYLRLFATSTRERAVDFRNWDLFGRIPIPVVRLDAQVKIGQRIRALRPLMFAVDQSRRLALERRQALITKIVTGELKIPGAA